MTRIDWQFGGGFDPNDIEDCPQSDHFFLVPRAKAPGSQWFLNRTRVR